MSERASGVARASGRHVAEEGEEKRRGEEEEKRRRGKLEKPKGVSHCRRCGSLCAAALPLPPPLLPLRCRWPLRHVCIGCMRLDAADETLVQREQSVFSLRTCFLFVCCSPRSHLLTPPAALRVALAPLSRGIGAQRCSTYTSERRLKCSERERERRKWQRRKARWPIVSRRHAFLSPLACQRLPALRLSSAARFRHYNVTPASCTNGVLV